MKIQQVKLKNNIELLAPVLFRKEIENVFRITNPNYLNICKQRGLLKSEYPPEDVTTKQKIKGRWITLEIPKYLFFYQDKKDNLIIPREGLFELRKLYKKNKVTIDFVEKRKALPKENITFRGELKEEQKPVLKWKSKKGILQSPTGSGKTVMGCWKIAQIKQPTLIIIDTNELLQQWLNRITQFLNYNNRSIKKEQIGIIGGGKIDIRPITVGLIQTIRKHPKLLSNFGLIMVDECQIIPTTSFVPVIYNYVGVGLIGLSATPFRKDGLTPVMHWFLGETKVIISNTKKCPCRVEFIGTTFKTKLDFQKQYSKALVKLTESKKRNQLIIKTALDNIDLFGIHLFLSSSSKHLKILYEFLPDHIKLITHFLIGEINDTKRQETVALMKEGKIKFIFATTALMKKGFDESLLSVLHLVTPVSDKYLITQMIGRITRIHPNKKHSTIFDYFDKNERVLRSSTKKRSAIYKSLNIRRIE